MPPSPPIDWRQFTPERPPVVLVGGLNLVRALGLAEIPAIVAGSDPYEPVFASRYCRARIALPPPDQPAAVVQALADLGDRIFEALGRRAPLMYGNDAFLRILYAHFERLGRHFRILANDPRIGNALLEKDRFDALGRERGLPLPRSLSWEGSGPGSVAAHRRPVLVKPRDKSDWHESILHARLFAHDGKALVFEDGPAARAHPLVARHHELLLFQDYVEGDDAELWSFHGVADEAGRVLASFVGRKIRTYPPVTGESAFVEMAHNPDLESVGRDVVARVPLRGIFKMDFKRNPRDGSYHLLEVNARYNLWNYLGAANGANLMAAAYDYLVYGRRPAPKPYATTRRWIHLGLDFRAYRALASQGRLGFADWVASLVAKPRVHHVFSWRDPGPLLSIATRPFRRRGEIGARLVVARMRQWLSTAS